MLSANHQNYSPSYGRLPPSDLINHVEHSSHQQAPMAGLNALATGSQYARQQMREYNSQHLPPQSQLLEAANNRNDVESRESVTSQKPAGKSAAAVRRRISRACDQCNQLRTKCDGKTPCAHCVEFGLSCEYVRERKKRGKASRKDLAAQQATPGVDGEQTSPRSANGASSEEQSAHTPRIEVQSGSKRRRSSSQAAPRSLPVQRSGNVHDQKISPALYNMTGLGPNPGLAAGQDHTNGHAGAQPRRTHASQDALPNTVGIAPGRSSSGALADQRPPFAVGDFESVDEYHRNVLQHVAAVNGQQLLHGGTTVPSALLQATGIQQYSDSPFPLQSPQSQHAPITAFRLGESPGSGGFLNASPNAGSPGWLALPSPSPGLYPNMQPHMSTHQSLRYPVLKPILPRISSIIPISLACDLLELYFASSSTAFVQPASPYILGFLLRKRSVLRKIDPRPCSQALLASMLWVSAQTSESSFLTSPPSQRGKICHQLLELTVSLLNPLIHTSGDVSAGYGAHSMVNGIALGGFGMANPTSHDMEAGSTGATAALDDVATYINLATVISASEYKSASLRWWNAAWSLARELKLGRELPPNHGEGGRDGDTMRLQDIMHPNMAQPVTYSEEEREERRRIWWLLYTVDRHLALCYNRPLFLLDVECEGLLQPETDAIWQAGDVYPPENQEMYFRRRGPSFECTGHSIFGYFLPLMTILGEIVDLNHARNHPRFGSQFRSGGEWESNANEVTQQLEAYGRSLKDFEARFIPPEPGVGAEHKTIGDGSHPDANSPSIHSTSTSTARMTESVLQTKIVVSYATHLMHTLHILLNGKWDPISLLDDNDLWISSQSFILATGHAVSAAEAIGDILEYDPDLSFMPFFFGIYLLQGSFLLLLIADKLQGEASPSVVKACETIVRAHEVCCVTLNTEYQRNFRKVMRSALSQVRGRMPEDFGEQQQRRREVLALYRWTGDGSGLAL